jgi:SNF2 family DNA or RNA helicase
VGGGRPRRVHLLPVRLSESEMTMHQLLSGYAKRVWQTGQSRNEADLQLVAIVLMKRALSSAASLACSVRRRLAALASRPSPAAQFGLPFDADDDDPSDVAPTCEAPAFDRPEDERSVLEGILSAADDAATDERKIAALLRLLRRTNEPAIVFTEYRDTLMSLHAAAGHARRAVLLHGGLNRHERRVAVETFTTGAADLLLATDAGSEGLNLQSNCRLVINLELPWNPVRLEQRIGRVDRIGQMRTVHAIHLFAARTAESRVLAKLVQRVERIRTEADIALEVIHDDQNRPTNRG